MLQGCYILLPQAAVNAEKSHPSISFRDSNHSMIDSTKRCPFMPFLAIQPSQAIHPGGQCSWLLQSSSPNQRNIGRLHTSFGSKPAQTRPKIDQIGGNVANFQWKCSHVFSCSFMQLHAASCWTKLHEETLRVRPHPYFRQLQPDERFRSNVHSLSQQHRPQHLG